MQVRYFDGLNPADTTHWEELVNRAPVPDVYFRPGYVRAYEFTGEGRPAAVLISACGREVLFPHLLREFDVQGTTYRDAVTPYGYGGMLLVSGPPMDLPATAELLEALKEWAVSQGLVSFTIRLHPILQNDLIGRLDELHRLQPELSLANSSKTKALDLKRLFSSGPQQTGVSKGRRYDLKRARTALEVRVSCGEAAIPDLALFKPLYEEAMRRLDADRFFFFGDDYHQRLARELGDDFAVISAFSQKRPVASAMFLTGCHFGHYHLAGGNEEGRQLGAATLLLMSGCEWARQRNCSRMHIGGGVQPNDSLWHFKESFGGDTLWYSYLTLTADKQRFRSLVTLPDTPWPYNKIEDAPQETTLVPARGSSSEAAPATRVKVVGIGGGGHANVIMDILAQSERLQVVGLVELDQHRFGSLVKGVPVLGGDDLLPSLREEGIGFVFIGIGGAGDNRPRAAAFERARKLGFRVLNAVHPRAVVASSAKVGHGVTIMACAVVNSGAVIGDNVILNSSCTVEHDCVIGNHAHVAPGATLSGNVKVGRFSHIGTGANVRQGVRIGDYAVVGVGAAVVEDVPDFATVVGVPARILHPEAGANADTAK